MSDERLRRWRLVLGSEAEEETGTTLSAADRSVDAALAALYDAEEGSGTQRASGLGSSAPRVARWLGDIRQYFPNTVVQVMQRDAVERLGITRMLMEPELLGAVEPDVHLVSTLLALNEVMPEETKQTARDVVGRVVAELDRSPAGEGVLRRGFEEAQLRGVPLRVLTAWQLRFTDIHDGGALADGTRLAEAQLDRRLAKWKKRYAEVDVHAVAVHGSTLNFLTENARSIQLLVVGRERPHGITELVGPPGYAALHNAACSVLICETQNVL